MTATVAPNPVAPTAAIERVLCDCVGSEVKIISTETLSDEDRRNLLVRCSIESNGRLPSSVVIKQARGDYDPEKLAHWDTLRLHRDWLGAQFLSAVSPAEHCPRFWAGDRELGFIILEDFGST
ncbi:MAG TPA: hypothetical protein VGP93_10370, partial [Polyangiaceae bacterium]|nr:hypothetical protein [Polyangiaceae bacterium]